MFHILIPVAGAAVAASAGGFLLYNRLNKTKPIAPVPPAPKPSTATVPATPAAAASILPPLTVNPDGSPRQPNTPIQFPSTSDAQAAVEKANAMGISVHELLLQQAGQLPTGSGSPAVAGKRGVVTTKDAPPDGDLIIRTAPNNTAPQISGGGADKGGIVTVVRDVDATWCEVIWAGGHRPGGKGYAKKAYIKLL